MSKPWPRAGQYPMQQGDNEFDSSNVADRKHIPTRSHLPPPYLAKESGDSRASFIPCGKGKSH